MLDPPQGRPWGWPTLYSMCPEGSPTGKKNSYSGPHVVWHIPFETPVYDSLLFLWNKPNDGHCWWSLHLAATGFPRACPTDVATRTDYRLGPTLSLRLEKENERRCQPHSCSGAGNSYYILRSIYLFFVRSPNANLASCYALIITRSTQTKSTTNQKI